MRQQLLGKVQHPGLASARSFLELRKITVERAREPLSNLTQCLAEKVLVIEKPFRQAGESVGHLLRQLDSLVQPPKLRLELGETRGERPGRSWFGSDSMSCGQAAREARWGVPFGYHHPGLEDNSQ
jgi:hypothetical protein